MRLRRGASLGLAMDMEIPDQDSRSGTATKIRANVTPLWCVKALMALDVFGRGGCYGGDGIGTPCIEHEPYYSLHYCSFSQDAPISTSP